MHAVHELPKNRHAISPDLPHSRATFDIGAPCKSGGCKLNKQNTSRETDAIQVDWIIMIASAIGLAVVIMASIQAGEGGLAANVVDYVTFDRTES